MLLFADKKQDNKKVTPANITSEKQQHKEFVYKFADNRPNAIVQRKLQLLMGNSAQKTLQLQAMIRAHTLQKFAQFMKPEKESFKSQTTNSNDQVPDTDILQRNNNTGLPNALKSGIENLSGHSMDDVRVHYNSGKPAQLNAHAYARDTDIYLGMGQEKHLPHEAWHVVQQKQGRVKPTIQRKGVYINTSTALETEADKMGEKAAAQSHSAGKCTVQKKPSGAVTQLNEKEEGNVPPTTHGRDQKYTAPPDNEVISSIGKRHTVPVKDLTRSERMINRIGRILVQKENVHVAVALDGNALVISANKENLDFKLNDVVKKLKDITDNIESDPLKEKERITDINSKRIKKDLKKVNKLLKGKYTGTDGVEMNENIKKELEIIKKAIEEGPINKQRYKKGDAGIYVIETVDNKNLREWNQHGELKVTEAIKDRRKTINDKSLKDVFIGGARLDCFDCNVSHKMMNDEGLKNKGWKFYSAGTHGGRFKGYRTSEVVSDNPEIFEELTGSSVNINTTIPKVLLNDKVNISHSQIPDESDSEVEDYDILKYERKRVRESKKNNSTFKEDVRYLKSAIESKEQLKKANKNKNNANKKMQLSQKLIKEIENKIKKLSKLNKNKSNKNIKTPESIIEEYKIKIEEKLKGGKEVSWDEKNKKWIPDSWVPALRTKDILENPTYNPSFELQELEKQKSLNPNQQKIKILNNNLIQQQTRIKKHKQELKKLKERINLLKKLSSNVGALKNDLNNKYGLTYEDIKKDENSGFSSKNKMDNFQFPDN